MDVSGFFRCDCCQKVHAFHGVSVTSRCSCGRDLWPLMWAAVKRVRALRGEF